MQELSVKAWAFSLAIFWGAYLFLVPIFAMMNITFMWFSNDALKTLSFFYPGLTASFAGALLGLFYGIICGAICGGLFAIIHNWVLKAAE